MNIHDLREAQVRFENKIEDILKYRKKLEKTRLDFVKYFNENKIKNMQLDEYVLGKCKSKNKSEKNFCYEIEWGLSGLGSMRGNTSSKFGIYYDDKNKKYNYEPQFGNTPEKAFSKIKENILQLLTAGKNKDFERIAENDLTSMFKGKILSTYYPKDYLSIFNKAHLNHFLRCFALDKKELIERDPVYKREELIKFKNQDVVMKKWDIDLFTNFLYDQYKPPSTKKQQNQKQQKDDPLADYRLCFPNKQTPKFIELNILSPSEPSRNKIKDNKTDFEERNKINKELGEKGEKIVLNEEKKKLIKADRKDLAERVEQVSQKSDTCGYDILSFEKDGTEKYIEVKATSFKAGGTVRFFISANELQKAQEENNYFIYMVFDIKSESPKTSYNQLLPVLAHNRALVIIEAPFYLRYDCFIISHRVI